MHIPGRIYLLLFLTLAASSCLHGQPRITYPNGGEFLRSGQDITIRWEGVGATETVRLEYSTDGGESWKNISASASGLQHPWRVPEPPSDRCLLRIIYTSGKPRVLDGYSDEITGAGYSNDERLIVAYSTWGMVVVKDAGTGETRWSVPDATWIQANPVYKTAVTVLRNTAVLRDVETGAVIDTLREAAGKVSVARFSPDGTMLVSSGRDGTLRLWDGRSGAYRQTLGSHTSAVRFIRFSRNSKRIVTFDENDGIMKVWDLNAGSLLQTITVSVHGLLSAALTPDGTKVTGVYSGTFVNVWDVATGQKLFTVSGERRVLFSPDGSQLLVGTESEGARVYDATTGALLHELKEADRELVGVTYSPDGERIALFHGDGDITLWSARTGELQKVLEGHATIINSLEFSRDGRSLLTASRDKTVRIWGIDEINQLTDQSDAPFTVWPTTLALSQIDMGRPPYGFRRDSLITAVIRNPAAKPLRVENITITENDAASFRLMPDVSAIEVPPNSSSDLRIRFTPARRGVHQAKLEMDAGGEHLVILLRGEGRSVGLAPQVEEINFGTLPMLQKRDSVVKVAFRNMTDRSIRVDSIRASPSFFHTLESVNRQTIEAGATMEVKLRFYPTSPDKVRTWLRVFYEGKDTASVALVGEGVRPSSVAGREDGEHALVIYPNPAGDRIAAEFDVRKPGPVRLLVQDLFGRTVQVRDLGTLQEGGHRAELDMSGIPGGGYLLVLETPGERSSGALRIVR